eukprot:PhF_6_TR8443/c0_g1_i3/m.13168
MSQRISPELMFNRPAGGALKCNGGNPKFILHDVSGKPPVFDTSPCANVSPTSCHHKELRRDAPWTSTAKTSKPFQIVTMSSSSPSPTQYENSGSGESPPSCVSPPPPIAFRTGKVKVPLSEFSHSVDVYAAPKQAPPFRFAVPKASSNDCFDSNAVYKKQEQQQPQENKDKNNKKSKSSSKGSSSSQQLVVVKRNQYKLPPVSIQGTFSPYPEYLSTPYIAQK